jgi:TatD DNase family protein
MSERPVGRESEPGPSGRGSGRQHADSPSGPAQGQEREAQAIRWTDDHCHLGWNVDEEVDADEVDAMVVEARDAGVERLVTVGTDALRSAVAVRAAARHPGVVWATVGLHPHEARHGLDGIVDLLGEPAVVAVGECGLDYHYDHSPRPVQRDMFAAQIALAHERDLALVIHTREAWDDTFAVLDAEGVPTRTVFHCFTGGPDEARACLDRDGYLSFSGIVTFGSADDVRAAAAMCPLERLLVETDSPYLAPVPHRGRPNRPALVPLVGAAVADTMGLAVEAVAGATWANAERVYRLH